MSRRKTVIIAIVVAIAFGYSTYRSLGGKLSDWSNTFIPWVSAYDHSECYSPASQARLTQDIRQLQIDWSNGDVQVLIDDSADIRWQEQFVTGETSASFNQLHYWIDEEKTLHIQYANANNWKKALQQTVLKKNLVITLPSALVLEELDIRSINNNIFSMANAKEISAAAVNGQIVVSTHTANKVSMESINGSLTLKIPHDASFQVEVDKVNGSFHSDFECQRHKNTYTHGNSSYIQIEMETINGSIYIEKE